MTKYLKIMWKNERLLSALFILSYGLILILVFFLMIGRNRYREVYSVKDAETYQNEIAYTWSTNTITVKDAYYDLPEIDKGILQWDTGGKAGDSAVEFYTIFVWLRIKETPSEQLLVTYTDEGYEEYPQVYIGQGIRYLVEEREEHLFLKVDGVECLVKGILSADTYSDVDRRIIVTSLRDELLSALDTYGDGYIKSIKWKSNAVTEYDTEWLKEWIIDRAGEAELYQYDYWDNEQGYVFSARNGLEEMIFILFLLYGLVAVIALSGLWGRMHTYEWAVRKMCGENNLTIAGHIMWRLLLYMLLALIPITFVLLLLYAVIPGLGISKLFKIYKNGFGIFLLVMPVMVISSAIIPFIRILRCALAQELKAAE